jgi:hypothetical protein
MPFTKEAQALGMKMHQRRADRRAADIAAIIADLRINGITSMRGVAAALNRKGIATAHNGRWQGTSVARLLKRLPAAKLETGRPQQR